MGFHWQEMSVTHKCHRDQEQTGGDWALAGWGVGAAERKESTCS